MFISCADKRYTDPLEPGEALKSFQLDENFKIELFASEPFVKDPVAMTFDDQGNVFVVEMPDYPFEPENGKGSGYISVLIDSNEDGRVDRAVVFADSLSEATSLLSWNGGMLVAAAPSIYFLKDTNGDFHADTKEELFSGFFKGNSEAQITGLYYNVDNWIYATNSGQSGTVSSLSAPDRSFIDMSGSDFRFRMEKPVAHSSFIHDRPRFELETGSGQFGQAMDEWGHRFVTENSFHVEQSVIPWRYLHRHAYMPPVRVLQSITDHEELMNQVTPPPYWRAERTKRRNEQFQEQKLNRTEYAEDHFTGAAGCIIYGGDAFPETYHGSYFVSDVAGNLVHRDILVPGSSPAYVALRTSDSSEFLTSTDPWFRPVNFCVGPDGSLYVIDMYRQHIESPFSIPEDLKEEMDFMNGSEMGRIYRITSKHARSINNPIPNFRNTDKTALLKMLSHPNYQLRIQAQKTIIERQYKFLVPDIKAMLLKYNDARARLHALYVLEGLNELNSHLLNQAIKDSSPNLRASVVQLAENYPECLPLIKQSILDTSIQVAFQACLSIGNFPAPQSVEALANCLIKYGHDKWFRTAVLSSEAGSSSAVLKLLDEKKWFDNKNEKGQLEFLKDLTAIADLRKDSQLKTLLLESIKKKYN